MSSQTMDLVVNMHWLGQRCVGIMPLSDWFHKKIDSHIANLLWPSARIV